MADQSDVENALVAQAAVALYPDGPGDPSVTGADCRIYRGWPSSTSLDSDLAAGCVNVTVFPMAEPGRNTTRYAQQWRSSSTPPVLTMSVSGTSVTVGGTVGAGQLTGILADGHTYVYRTQARDTPETVAANLAQLARADWIVILSQATLTISGAANLQARAVADAQVVQEVRRQEQGFRITCWCPTPTTRDTTASAIDLSLAGIKFIDLADGTQGRLRYRGTMVFDQSQDALLYRRDMIYDVEYPTIENAKQPSMLFGDLIINASSITA